MSAVLESQISFNTLSVPNPGEDLTIKQKSFADLWLEHRNGRLAASLAGYDGDDATLRAIASENLTKPNIRAYIDSIVKERHLSADQVLAELGDIAAYSLDSIAVEGSPVRTADKVKALELYGKFHKLFTDRIETSEPNAEDVAEAFVKLVAQACERMRTAQLESPVIETTATVVDNPA